jgi:AraC-like DNA-binding protein
MTNILLFNPIYVTLFWAISLSFKDRRTHEPKRFLGIFMLVASLVYISHYFYFTKNFAVYLYFDSIYTLAYLLVYPMYHIYVRLLTVDYKFSIRKHYPYLIAPIVISIFTFMGYIILGKEGGLRFVKHILMDGEVPSGFFEPMYILFILGRITFLFQTFFYLILSFKLIKQNNRRMLEYYSNTEDRQLNWLQFFNICFAITSFSGAALAAVGRNFFLNNQILLIIPSVVFTILLFFIGLLGNTQKAIFTEIESAPESQDEGKINPQLKTKLDELFEREKIYKNQDLKIWDVSSMLGTNRTYVSRIINKEYNRNFCAHVNFYRIQHAKQLIGSNPNLNNEQIAELSGFGSLNSFYRAFQASEEVSLGQYRKKT